MPGSRSASSSRAKSSEKRVQIHVSLSKRRLKRIRRSERGHRKRHHCRRVTIRGGIEDGPYDGTPSDDWGMKSSQQEPDYAPTQTDGAMDGPEYGLWDYSLAQTAYERV